MSQTLHVYLTETPPFIVRFDEPIQHYIRIKRSTLNRRLVNVKYFVLIMAVFHFSLEVQILTQDFYFYCAVLRVLLLGTIGNSLTSEKKFWVLVLPLPIPIFHSSLVTTKSLKPSNKSLIQVVHNWTLINFVCSLQHNKVGNTNKTHNENRPEKKPFNYVAPYRSTKIKEKLPNQDNLSKSGRQNAPLLKHSQWGMKPCGWNQIATVIIK